MASWNNTKEQQQDLEKRGVDYDLETCLEFNSQEFTVFDIEAVLAVHEGENDGDDWRWILKLKKNAPAAKNGKFVFMQGGCDYTGWDCQSWATGMFTTSAKKAAKFAFGKDVEIKGKSPKDAGLGHILNLLSGTYLDNATEVYEELLAQLQTAKSQTWREKKNKEFGL